VLVVHIDSWKRKRQTAKSDSFFFFFFFFFEGAAWLTNGSLNRCYLADMEIRVALESATKYCMQLLGGTVLDFTPTNKPIFESLITRPVIGSPYNDVYAVAGMYNFTPAGGGWRMQNYAGQGACCMLYWTQLDPDQTYLSDLLLTSS
jgi:hypothetical protein